MFEFALILLVAVIVAVVMRNGLARGFPFAAALLVALPTELRIDLAGQLPELSIHRIILGILLLRWLQEPRRPVPPVALRLKLLLFFALVSRCVSDLLSVTPGPSLKDLLGFAFETVVYYHLASAAVVTRETRYAVLRAITLALVVVAGIAFVERYTHVNLPHVVLSKFKYLGDGIQSTYPHRILLGYAMAMGVPVTLHLLDLATSVAKRRGYWIMLVALIVACFLSDTRGGWIGLGLGGALSFFLSNARTRKRCLFLVTLTIVALLGRPGVRETIEARLRDTMASDSYKGASYQYRWRLWNVAFSEITHSPQRALFGYGGQSTETMDLSRYFRALEGGTASKIGYTSWDNHYASDMIEFGMVGLGIELLMCGLIVTRLYGAHRRMQPPERHLIGAALSSSVIFMFARTNVFIFSPQLIFLFWTLVAIGAAATAQETVPRVTSRSRTRIEPQPAHT